MIEETNCEEVNKKIRATIDRTIEKFKDNHQAWEDERHVHYDFFKFLFDVDVFSPEQIKTNFVWEYQKGEPAYSRTIALVMFCGKNKMVSIDFKLDKSPNVLRKKLIDHIEIQSKYKDSLFRGYIVPLYYYRNGQAVAQKQNHNMTYQELLSEIIKEAKQSIKDQRIELIEAGIILGGGHNGNRLA